MTGPPFAEGLYVVVSAGQGLFSSSDVASVCSAARRGVGSMLQFLSSADAALQERSYVDGFSASALDRELLGLVGGPPDAARYPHLARWYRHVQSLTRLGEPFPPAAAGRSLLQCGIVVPAATPATRSQLAAASPTAPAVSAEQVGRVGGAPSPLCGWRHSVAESPQSAVV